MQNTLYFITSFFFFVWVVRNILYWLWLWQIKEYRFDRLVIHIKETRQGKKLLYGVSNIIKLFVFFLYFIFIFNDQSSSIYQFLVFSVFLMSFLNVVEELIYKKIKLPILTIKSGIIGFTTISLVLLFYIVPLVDRFFWLMFLDRLIFAMVAIQIGVFSVPSEFYKDILIAKAIEKRNKYKDLLVIGITGSFGKGSTKEYLSTVLSHKYQILKTPGTYNTLIGIAKTVLSGLTSQTEIFVVEMGAYKLGEIEEMCEIVKPKIGILTSVNDQHISLFGSLENTMHAKYELIESLPREGLALFNGNNPGSIALSQKTKKKKIVYFADYDNNNSGDYDIKAVNIRVSKFYLSFDAIQRDPQNSLKSLRMRLIGKYNIENILPAVFLAQYFGMNSAEIKNSLKLITPLKKTMEPYLTPTGAVLIDDTFNANPASVVAASEYMKLYRGKKIFVLQPMIELGKNAYDDHYQVCLTLGKICNTLFLTNDNFLDAFKKGIYNSQGSCKVEIASPSKIAEYINTQLGKNDVVVFEGKESVAPLSYINSEKIYHS